MADQEGASTPATGSAAARELLSSTLVEHLPNVASRDYIDSRMSLSDALDALVVGKHMSLPVYDVHLRHFAGYLDLLDVCTVVTRACRGLADSLDTYSDFSHLFSRLSSLQRAPVASLANLSRRNPFLPVELETDLLECVQLMHETKTRRLAVMAQDWLDRWAAAHGEGAETLGASHLRGTIEEWDILDFVYGRMDTIGGAPRMTVGELMARHPARRKVVSVGPLDPVLHAFDVMSIHRVSGLPVVDGAGALIGALSASDIRSFFQSPGDITRLYGTVEEALGVIDAQLSEEGGARLLPVISVTETDTVGILIAKMVDNCVRRVFVTGEDGSVLGVLTPGDVLHELVHGADKHHHGHRGHRHGKGKKDKAAGDK